MPRNIDNEIKQENGNKAKRNTFAALKDCEVIDTIKRGPNLTRNPIERASCDLEILLNNHPSISILIHSTHSLRDDRLAASNACMGRLKKRYGEQKKKVICIMSTDCDNERAASESSRLLNGYNLSVREDVGIDFIVKTGDIANVLAEMNNVEDKNDVASMIAAAKKVIKEKNY